MKNLILGALVVLAAACGGGGKPQLLDAAVDSLFACNPVAQTGCKTDEKCTWIVDVDAVPPANEIGHIGCAPVAAMPIADGLMCMDAVVGTVDACIKGDLCISRKCKPICDPQTASGVAGSCMPNFACTTYAAIFDAGGSSVAGVCEPACDPLTQQLKVGTSGTDACGSLNPAAPGRTCVFTRDPAVWACVSTDSTLYEKTDLKPAATNPVTNFPYSNGCAPGFVPVFAERAGSMIAVCSGICSPLKTDMDIVQDPAHRTDNQGNAAALAKLTNELAPKAGNAVCVSGRKGSAEVLSPLGEDCRYYWWATFDADPSKATPNPYNDSLGYCFAYERFMTDKQQPLKSCAALMPPAKADPKDPFTNAALLGCYPLADSMAAARKASYRMMPLIRPGYAREPLVRHILD